MAEKPALEGEETRLFPKRYTVFVVDDDPEIRKMVKLILEGQKNFQVLEASDGHSVLRAFDDDVDLVLLDIDMPGLDGIQTCRNLKRNSKLQRALPIIMLTAKRDRASVIGALNAGADDYIVKPFTPEVLLEKVRNNLSGHSRRR